MGSILRNQSPPSPTQSTDSLYSSSVGSSASATCRSPVPRLASKTTTFSHDRPFERSIPAKASYGGTVGRSRVPPNNTEQQPRMTDYHPFQRLSARSVSLRQPRVSPMNSPTLLGSSVPRPYVPGRIGLAEQKSLILQQRATIHDQFFQTPLTAPPLISSMMSGNNIKSKLSLPRTDKLSGNGSYMERASPAQSTVSSSASKKYYKTDLDLTIKVPKKSSELFHQETRKSLASSETGGSTTASRVINISVVNSESLNYVSQNNETNVDHLTNKENTEDIKVDRPNFTKKASEDNFRTFPSLTELNINFKSITGQKILQGPTSNSTDTLVELSMRDCPDVGKSDLSYV